MALAEILKAYMKERGIKAETIARQMEVSRPTITHWSNGFRKPKTPEQYRKLAEILGVEIDKLLDPTPLLKSEAKELLPLPKPSLAILPPLKTYKIPVLEMVAGFGSEGVFDVDLKTDYELIISDEMLGRVNPKFAKIIKCYGDSMEPDFENGDYMLIEMLCGRAFVKRPGLYLVRVGEVVYIKRVEFLPDGDALLISLNQAYKSFQPLKDYGIEYEIIGAVYGKISVKLGASFQFDNQGIN